MSASELQTDDRNPSLCGMPMRPHHGLCFQFYEGKGYSEEFTDHMGQIIQMLGNNPETKLHLQVQTDLVCKNCPNNNAGYCKSLDKVSGYDHAVLDFCGLKEGSIISYQDFTALIKEKILAKGLRKEICGDCVWNSICESGE